MSDKQNPVVLAILMVMTLIAGSVADISAAEPALILRMGVGGSEGGTRSVMAGELAAKIGEAGGGKLSVTLVHYADADANSKIYDDLVGGILDVALIDDWALGGKVPSLSMLSSPYVFANTFQAGKFYEGAGGERINELTSPLGFRIEGWLKPYSPVIVSKVPLTGPDAFPGVRVAAEPNPGLIATLGALGAEYVRLPADKRLAALQSGAVDAVEMEPVDLLAADVLEAAPEINAPGLTIPYIAVCVSNKALTQIGSANREVWEEGLESGIIAAADGSSSANADALAKLAEAGYVMNATDTLNLRAKITDASSEPATTDRGLLQAMEEATAPTATF